MFAKKNFWEQGKANFAQILVSKKIKIQKKKHNFCYFIYEI